MVIFFIVAIARAWQMIGARDIGMFAVTSDLLRERRHQQTTILPDPVDKDNDGPTS